MLVPVESRMWFLFVNQLNFHPVSHSSNISHQHSGTTPTHLSALSPWTQDHDIWHEGGRNSVRCKAYFSILKQHRYESDWQTDTFPLHCTHRENHLFLHDKFDLNPLWVWLGPHKTGIDQIHLQVTATYKQYSSHRLTTQKIHQHASGVVHIYILALYQIFYPYSILDK